MRDKLTVNLVLVNSNSNSLRSELIDTLTFSHKHNLKLLSVRVVVDELSKSLVNNIILNWDIDSNSLLQFNDVVLEGFNFDFSIFQLSK